MNAPTPPVEPELPPSPSVPVFPGALRLGSQGAEVKFMQNLLDSISQVYTSIPTINPDGVFGQMTDSAVRAFQREFGLAVDGVIGKTTWYKIIDVYEGLTENPNLPQFPGTNLTVGSRGNDVLLMQRYIGAIAKIFPVIPGLSADGIFGTGTAASVRAFQTFFGLSADGVIGQNTWNKVVYIYNTLPDVASPVFAGTTLQSGSRGNDVIIMQKYLNVIAAQGSTIPSVGAADGVFGPRTEQAVKAFQTKHGLTADGKIGSITWNRIVSEYNLILMYLPEAVSENTYKATSANTVGVNFDRLALLLAFGNLKNIQS